MNIVRKILRIYKENTMDTVWNTVDIVWKYYGYEIRCI